MTIVAAAVVGCQGADEDPCTQPEYSVQVDLAVPIHLGEQRVVLYWADQGPEDGVAAPPEPGVLHLRRAFATRAEAVAFDEPFVVAVDGVERGRASISLAECDQVAAVGHAPGERRQGRFTYSFGVGDQLMRALGFECLATAGLPTLHQQLVAGCEISERRLAYRFEVPGNAVATRVLVDDTPTPPSSISQWPDTTLYEIEISSPRNVPIERVRHQLVIEQDGVRSTALAVDFETCVRLANGSGFDADLILHQRRGVEVVDGVLEVDPWFGYSCSTPTETVYVNP